MSDTAMDIIDWDRIRNTLISGDNANGLSIISVSDAIIIVTLLQQLYLNQKLTVDQINNLTDALLNARSSDVVHEIAVKLASEANAPIVSSTILKVEFCRKLFLIALGVSGGGYLLETSAPGSLQFIFSQAVSLFQTLRSQKIPDEAIAAGAASSSPFSAGDFFSATSNFASGAANLAATASSSLVTAAFSACAQVSGFCLNVANKAVCLAFNIDNLAFASKVAVATVAERVAERVVKKPAKSLWEAAMGEFDKAAADYFDNGGIERDVAIAQQFTLKAYCQGRNNGISAIKTAFDNMTEINSKFDKISADWAPNRGIAPNVNRKILDIFSDTASSNARQYKLHLGDLISDLSSIDFSPNNKSQECSIIEIIQKYSEKMSIEKIRSLITLWILVHDRVTPQYTMSQQENASYREVSLYQQMEIRELKRYNPVFRSEFWNDLSKESSKFTRCDSAPSRLVTSSAAIGRNFYSEPIKQTKINNQLESSDEFESVFGFDTESNVKISDNLLKILLDNGITYEDEIKKQGVFQYLGSLGSDEQARLIIKIKQVGTRPAIGTTYNESINNQQENKTNILKAISPDELNLKMTAKRKNLALELTKQYGGRRIKSTKAKKSRHNNKKRSTIKRKKARQMPRKTRKGKKKRYTQKRR